MDKAMINDGITKPQVIMCVLLALWLILFIAFRINCLCMEIIGFVLILTALCVEMR